jgi:UDP-2-acetamido-3-amino-2,3-dideoxy-glucuronate N-acetyltransferase
VANLCVVGAGYWGKNLVRTFHELGVLYAVCDVNPATLRAFEEPHPDAQLIPDPRHVLEDSRIDAVAIAAPAELHFALAKQALEAGKHVFCEKPLALRASEGRMLCELADSAGRVLQVGHLLEFHPAVIAMASLVAQGELGELWYAWSNRLKFGRFRTEENVLWSFAPHDISILNAVLGRAPVQVSAASQTCVTQGVADVAVVRLEFAGALRAHIHVSWLNPFPERKVVVVGSRRMAVFDDLAEGTQLQVFETGQRREDGVPVALPVRGKPIETPGEPPLLAECRHFLDCIERGVRPRTDGESALKVLRVLEACQESMDTGGQTVEVASS